MTTLKELANALEKTIPQTTALIEEKLGVTLGNKGNTVIENEIIERLTALTAGELQADTESQPKNNDSAPVDAQPPAEAQNVTPETSKPHSLDELTGLVVGLASIVMFMLHQNGHHNEIHKLNGLFQGKEI